MVDNVFIRFVRVYHVLPDVQTCEPDIPVNLSRVGAKGIKKLVMVTRGKGRPAILISSFDVFVNLNPTRKGINLSRSFEAIDEVIESLTAKPVRWIEDLNIMIVETLLERHEYATKAEVYMVSELILRKRTPVSGYQTQEVVNVLCEASKERGGNEKVFIGVEVPGITACPCAQELVKAKAVQKLRAEGFTGEETSKILSIVPVATHNQRGKATVKVQITDGFKVSAEQLIDIAKAGMSYDIYEILKREDELAVVESAHKNPMFVEDSVRMMAKTAVEMLKNAPDDITVFFKQENEESIHQHNVMAERVATMRELRMELQQ